MVGRCALRHVRGTSWLPTLSSLHMHTHTQLSSLCLVVAINGCASNDAMLPPPSVAARDVRPAAAVAAEGFAASVRHGSALFSHSWSKGDALSRGGDGLGPSFNGSSCVGCHNQGAVGGAGGAHANTFVVDGEMMPRNREDTESARRTFNDDEQRRVVLDNGGAIVGGGLNPLTREVGELLDMTRTALQKCFTGLKVEGPNRKFGFMTLQLKFGVDARGVVTNPVTVKALKDKRMLPCIEGALATALLPSAAAASNVTWTLQAAVAQGAPRSSGQRNPTALWGAGVIDTIADADLRVVVDDKHPEITGVVGRAADGAVARFGWKGDVKNLATFVSRACALEVGLEVPGVHQFGFTDVDARPLDLNADDVNDLTQFARSLAKPTRSGANDTQRGEQLFTAIGCTACHQQQLGDVDGIYSDLLLHDMGARLADGGGYGGGGVLANDREWRTPPLWGARDSGPWMHDGRSATLAEAITEHSGEATLVRAAFDGLHKSDREAIVSFLESLQANNGAGQM